MSEWPILDVMLGNYAHTAPLKSGAVQSTALTLRLADVASPSSAFKDVLALKYDVAELSVPTFLIARSRGVPLALLPADMFCRYKPPLLVCDERRAVRSPRDLIGCRIGIGYYTATTTIWMQCLLGNSGVDPASLRWTATDGPLVDGFRDPPQVQRAAGAKLPDLLRDGEVDAIVTTSVPGEPHFKAVPLSAVPSAPGTRPPFPEMQSHHMLVARAALVRERPDLVRGVWSLLLQARSTALGPGDARPPYGLSANRSHLADVIEACHKLKIISERPFVDDLFDDVTASLRG